MRRSINALDLVLQTRRSKKRSSGIKTAVIGCNIDPFCGRAGELAVRYELSSYDLITTRDKKSEEYISRVRGAGQGKCFPDIVFAMPKEWLYEKKPEALGICAYRRGGADNLVFYRRLARAADSYIEKCGKRVLLFAFDIESENDLAAAVTIRSLCRHPEMTEIIAHTDNGSSILAGLARCERLIAVRFHSMVMSLLAKIPFMPVCYSEKSVNMLKDLNYDGKIYELDNVTEDALIGFALNGGSAFALPEATAENARSHFELFKKDILCTEGEAAK